MSILCLKLSDPVASVFLSPRLPRRLVVRPVGAAAGVTIRGRIEFGVVVGWLCEDQGLEAAADLIAQLVPQQAVFATGLGG